MNWSPPHGSTKPLQLQRVSLCLGEIVVQVMCPFWCRLSFFHVDLLTAVEFYGQIWWLKSHPSITVCLVQVTFGVLRFKFSTSPLQTLNVLKQKKRRKSPKVTTTKDSSSNSLAHHRQASAWTRVTIQRTQPKHTTAVLSTFRICFSHLLPTA